MYDPLSTQRVCYERFVPNEGGIADYVTEFGANIALSGPADSGNEF